MIKLAYIKQFYSTREQQYDQFLLKEYLQYQILDIVYSSTYGKDLVFLWGTAIRLIHGSNRFSEDLDFDNFGLSIDDFGKLSEYIWAEMNKRWFETEFRTVYKWAYHCYIKIPKVLKELWFSHMEDEKILIQLDSVDQDYEYNSDKIILDKFDVYKTIQSCPIDILLSKKIHALLGRKRSKWRDFFDIIFLKKLTEPNYDYLKNKLGISSPDELIIQLRAFCKDKNLISLADDVERFLINPDELQRVIDFENIIPTF